MLEILGGIGLFGIIGLGFVSGQWVTGFFGVVLMILAFGLGSMPLASLVSIGYLIFMIKSGRAEKI